MITALNQMELLGYQSINLQIQILATISFQNHLILPRFKYLIMIHHLALRFYLLQRLLKKGEPIWFQLNSTPPLADSTSIDIQLEQVGDFMAETTFQLSVTIAALNSKTLFNIATIDDELYEADGVVSATIPHSRDYQVTSSYQTASVRVLDNDLPIISISSVDSIVEGEFAEFELLSTLAPFAELRVNLAISQVGEFIAGTPLSHSIFSANLTSSSFSIPTINDDIDEYHGKIEVEILPGHGYTIASESTNLASLIVEDNDNPVISIGAENIVVDEGDSVVFRLESTTPLENDLEILVRLLEVEEYSLIETVEIIPYLSADTR